MKNSSKVLLGVAAVSGIAAYIVNKVGSSKKDEPSFEDTLELYRSDIEHMSFDELDSFIGKLDEREIPSNLTDTEKSEYLKAVSEFSDKVQKASTRFVESGELSDEEGDILRQTFCTLRLWAEHAIDLDKYKNMK